MGKSARKTRRPKVEATLTPLARVLQNIEIEERQSHLAIITPEQHITDNYEQHNGRMINSGGTPVARWKRQGMLSETQIAAINFCIKIWSWLETENGPKPHPWGIRIPGSDEQSGRRILNSMEARDDIHRIRDYVPAAYWSVFENVCRWDEPAGLAGSKLGLGSRSASDRAHTIVCFVADIVHMREL